MDYIFDLAETALNDNWLVSNRLLEDGSEESLKKFEELDKIEMVAVETPKDEEEEEG